MILIILALVFAIPSYGLSLLAYVTYYFVRAHLRKRNDFRFPDTGINASAYDHNSKRSGGLLRNKDEVYLDAFTRLDRLLKERSDFYGEFLPTEREGMEADTDHPLANVVLGLIYHAGIHVAVDFDKAESYYLASVKLGCPLAYKYLCSLENDKGNREAADVYIQKGIDHGDSEAMLMLGAYYANEIEFEGGTKDLAKARILFERAARLGNEAAKHNLRVLDGNF